MAWAYGRARRNDSIYETRLTASNTRRFGTTLELRQKAISATASPWTDGAASSGQRTPNSAFSFTTGAGFS